MVSLSDACVKSMSTPRLKEDERRGPTFEVRRKRLGDALDLVQAVDEDVRGPRTFTRCRVGGSWRRWKRTAEAMWGDC